jgi:hypothetical protein
MSIQTLEQLSDCLDSQIAWRKKELVQVKNLIEQKGIGASKNAALVRCGVAILYAHWEGFIKESSASYLEFVSRKRLRYCELSSNFVALAMKAKLNEANSTNRATLYIKVANFFLTELEERSQVPYENVVKTSNLSSKILKDIVCTLGLDYKHFETKEKLIDEQLLKSRNTIAHGSYLSIDADIYTQLHSEMMSLMEIFKTELENAACQKRYLKQSLNGVGQ